MTTDNGSTPPAGIPGTTTGAIDPVKTLALAQASLAAYNDFEGKPITSPANYRLFARFTGWDAWGDKLGEEERFGLIFKHVATGPNGNRFIVAFRGTDSYSDMLEDLFWERTTFTPYRNSVSPIPDDVCTGFNGIYATKGGTMASTMQQQIFSLLPPQPAEVLVTGHSLGGALSQLFALDLRISFPGVRTQTINFSSPKVGGEHWASACLAAGATSAITRVINYYDFVPDFPLSLSDQYHAVGAEFQTAFYGHDWGVFDELPRHRLLNLQTVLQHSLWLTPQVWVGTFWDAVTPTYAMKSVQPPLAPKNMLLASLKDLHQQEVASRPPMATTSD